MADSCAPLVSVVMSVRNGERHLREAVDSVLDQTLESLELIVVDDGSTDGSAAVLAAIRDPRLLTISQEPRGLAAALNAGIARARADLIARMDADDVADPKRLEIQQAAMQERPGLALLGTAATLEDESGRELGVWRPPETQAEIRRLLPRLNPFAHPTVMFRRDVVEALGGYRESMPFAQDYDLWLRLVPRHETANHPEILLRRRLGPEQFGTASETRQIRWALRARLEALGRGDVRPWEATALIRPALAALTPGPLRQWIRRRLPGSSPVARRWG